MWAYWLMFLVPAGIAFSPIKGDKYVQRILWTLVGLLCVLLIGLRYEVGGDWVPYLMYLKEADGVSLRYLMVDDQLTNGSIYFFLNWVAIQLGFGIKLGIYFVNTICAAITIIGLIKYCQKQPMPWLALMVAMPYLVCIVAMGYTRQATALGFLMWGLSFLRKGNELKFLGLIFLGSLFHLSLVFTLPLVVLTRKKIHWLYYPFFGLFVFGLYYLFSILDLLEAYETVFEWYLGKHSVGGEIRAYMNVLPVIASFFFWQRIKRISPDYKIIKWMSIAALLSIPLLSLSTTLVDRFALYLMPLQLALWPRLIAVQSTMFKRSIWASMIFFYYGLVIFTWFNFGVHASFWVPYRMWPFTSETIYQPFL